MTLAVRLHDSWDIVFVSVRRMNAIDATTGQRDSSFRKIHGEGAFGAFGMFLSQCGKTSFPDGPMIAVNNLFAFCLCAILVFLLTSVMV